MVEDARIASATSASNALKKLLKRTTGIVAKDSNKTLRILPKPNKTFFVGQEKKAAARNADLSSSSDSDSEAIDVIECQKELADFERRLHESQNSSESRPKSDYESFNVAWCPELPSIQKLRKKEQTIAGVYSRMNNLRLSRLGITSLDSEFRQNLSNVVALNVSENNIERLQNIPDSTKELDAYNCKIKEISPNVLASRNLVQLGLGYNLLNEFPIFSATSSLLSLDLSYNNLCDITRVLEALKHLPSLSQLFLVGNPISLCRFYRLHTITAAPSVEVLDDIDVTDSERSEREKEAPQTKFCLKLSITEISGLCALPESRVVEQELEEAAPEVVEKFEYIASYQWGNIIPASRFACESSEESKDPAFKTAVAAELPMPTVDLRDAVLLDQILVSIWVERSTVVNGEDASLPCNTLVDAVPCKVSFTLKSILDQRGVESTDTGDLSLKKSKTVPLPKNFYSVINATDQEQEEQTLNLTLEMSINHIEANVP